MAKLHNITLGILASVIGGAICAWLKTPLPWMIGPLLAMAICNFSGARLAAPAFGREFGQMVIAVTLGLYFTPVVAREVLGQAGVLVAAAFGSILIGYIGSRVLMHYTRTDDATAFFASVPGGATEMANLGERFGAAVDKVAVAHSLRILMVVCTIPVLLTLANVHGGDRYDPVLVPFSWIGLLVPVNPPSFQGDHMNWTRFPNAWMMGPLVATIVVTATGNELSSMLGFLTNCGQVLLACALGSRFSRSFLRDAPRFISAVVGCILLMITLSAAMGWGLASLTGIFVPTMLLAAAPGGIAEMSITARALQLGVALVTAAHVTRVIIIVTLSLPTFQLIQKIRRRMSTPTQ
ncbi:MAG: AbrB family transcriptional regulator [Betaproteobacteria bacterium]